MTAKAAGKLGFDHPYVQVLFMFFGECFCLVLAPFFGGGTPKAKPGDIECENAVSPSLQRNVDHSDTMQLFDNSESASEAINGIGVMQGRFGMDVHQGAASSAGLVRYPTDSFGQTTSSVAAESSELILGEEGTQQSNNLTSPESQRWMLLDRSVFKFDLPLSSFVLPALLDAIGSTLIFLGIQRTTAAKFQLMRSTLVPFTGLVSFFAFGRVPTSYELVGVLFIVAGVALVSLVRDAPIHTQHGTADGEDEEEDIRVHSEEFIGNMLVVASQLVIAIMLVYEERMYRGRIHTMVAIGLEGIFGIAFTCLLIFCLELIPDETKPWGTVESIHAAFDEISSNYRIGLMLVLNALAVTMLNSFGVSMAVMASAAHRTVVDTLRIVFIWAASLIIGWEKTISPVQLVSFLLLVIGIGVYNKLIQVPCQRPIPEIEDVGISHSSGGQKHSALSEPLIDHASNFGEQDMNDIEIHNHH